MNSMIRKHKKFIATCAAGLEELIAQEIETFGGRQITSSTGAVCFSSSMPVAYRACLWSRFASRILMVLGQFEAIDTDALYTGVRSVDWNKYFGVTGTFAVDAAVKNSEIKHSRFAALRVKDAVVDQFMETKYRRPSVDTKKPDIRLHLLIENNAASICLDLSGEALHQRGYRVSGGATPLKETLAAAIVSLSGWSKDVDADAVLLDPMCGSGTLLIEAAFMWAGIAPGLRRGFWGFQKWRGHNAAVWDDLMAEAREIRQTAFERPWPKIIGFDAGLGPVRSALANLEQAGLDARIHVERRSLAQLENLYGSDSGFIVVNPPYGERHGGSQQVRYLYRCLGRVLHERFEGWRCAAISSDQQCLRELRINIQSTHTLNNGPLVCELRCGEVVAEGQFSSSARFLRTRSPSEHEKDFANRLRKNRTRLQSWLKESGASCYRLYDADIPEYNVAVDVYDKWVHVQEYAPPSSVDARKAESRLEIVRRDIEAVFQIDARNVFMKVRRRHKGTSQYQKHSEGGRLFEVHEGNCSFLVNLSDYLDSGLFLDHRSVRFMLGDMACQKRFLNLYGYTGTATVHAALGGALRTVTVDQSAQYLAWAESNLYLNGLGGDQHRFVREDCMQWLETSTDRFELIFIAPPTFSNTKKREAVFDVQRDHYQLLESAARRLESGGVIVFSTHARRFKMDERLERIFSIEDITARTMPPDFVRTPRIHQSWILRRHADSPTGDDSAVALNGGAS
jgi:23S rRNA (guanine2445-N2)-methyltransferase / 23S rRNA (guanine2069-N7)-methyltransferase